MTPYRFPAVLSAIGLTLVLWLSPVLARLGPPPPLRPQQRSTVPAAETASPVVVPRHLGDVAAAVQRAVNAERSQRSLRSLEAEPGLADIAAAHCDDMLVHGFFGQESQKGEGPQDRLAAQHRRMIGGSSQEILWRGRGLANGDADQVGAAIVSNWMGNEEDRERILGSRWTHLGTAASEAGDELRATLVLAEVVAYLDEPMVEKLPVGSEVSWRAHPLTLPAPEEFDLFADGRPWGPPQPLNGTRLDAEPGVYRLRFYFPSASGRRIAYGPRVEVVP